MTKEFDPKTNQTPAEDPTNEGQKEIIYADGLGTMTDANEGPKQD